MKLTKKLQITKYQVQAEYLKSQENKAFLAVLKSAMENRNQITATELQKNLLYPLPVEACKNLLERLTVLNYFEIENKRIKNRFENYLNNNLSNEQNINNYKLTAFGLDCAKQEKILLPEKAVLNLYFVENEFVNSKLIRVEILQNKDLEKEKTIDLPSRITDLKKFQHTLKGFDFKFEKFENKCIKLENIEFGNLEIISSEKISTAKILDYETILDKDETQITNEILKNQYLSNYDFYNQCIKINFDGNTNFNRNIKIEKPKIQNTEFQSIEIKNVKHIPINYDNALIWQEELLKSKIVKYISENKQFDDLSIETSKQFSQHYILQPISKNNLLNRLDFYKRAKLETIDILTF